MIKVEQTIYGPPKGDCVRACVASLFELSIDDVPNFMEANDAWWDDLVEWASKRNYIVLDIPHTDRIVVGGQEVLPAIAIVPTGFGYNHCVVGCMSTNQVLWDPLPGDKLTGDVPEGTHYWRLFVRKP